MKINLLIIIILLIIISGCSKKQKKINIIPNNLKTNETWSTYGNNLSRASSIQVPYIPNKFKLKWKLNSGEHTYQYNKGYSVWSLGIPIFKFENSFFGVAGCYNKTLYCINLETGKKLWEKITLAPVLRTLEYKLINNDPYLFYVSEAREFTMINALDGKEIFRYEIEPWIPESNPSFSGPGVWKDNTLCFTVYTSTRKSFKFEQKTEYFEFDAIKKEITKRVILSDQKINGISAHPSSKGILFSHTTRLGNTALFYNPENFLKEEILASACHNVGVFNSHNNNLYYYCNDHFGSLFCFNLTSDEKAFQYKAGYMIPGKSAVYTYKEFGILAAGGVDRNLYFINPLNGTLISVIHCDNSIQSSPTLIYTTKDTHEARCISGTISGKLFLTDPYKGKILDTKTGEPPLWAFETKAETIYSEIPAWIDDNKNISILFASVDGFIYCYNLIP